MLDGSVYGDRPTKKNRIPQRLCRIPLRRPLEASVIDEGHISASMYQNNIESVVLACERPIYGMSQSTPMEATDLANDTPCRPIFGIPSGMPLQAHNCA